MVHFTRRGDGGRQRLTVRSARATRGHRLVVTYPDRTRRVHDFPDDASLYRGTVNVQATLTREGWEPVRPPAHGWRSQLDRARQFPAGARV